MGAPWTGLPLFGFNVQCCLYSSQHSLTCSAICGQLYLREGDEGLATQAFDRARSSNPLLSLPWAGMSFIHSSKGRLESVFTYQEILFVHAFVWKETEDKVIVLRVTLQ